MKRERGLTLLGLIFLLALAVVVALIAFRVVPTYIDYYTLRNSLENILANGTDQTNDELRSTFEKRMDVNYMPDITGRDLDISRDDGMLTLSVPIDRKQHLVGGVSISIDLVATASAPIGK